MKIFNVVFKHRDQLREFRVKAETSQEAAAIFNRNYFHKRAMVLKISREYTGPLSGYSDTMSGLWVKEIPGST